MSGVADCWSDDDFDETGDPPSPDFSQARSLLFEPCEGDRDDRRGSWRPRRERVDVRIMRDEEPSSPDDTTLERAAGGGGDGEAGMGDNA